MASSSQPNRQPHDESASYAALLEWPGLVEHHIYKVPERFCKGNEELYRPRVVSIGPYHYKYIRSGGIKLQYGNQFCDRYKLTLEQLRGAGSRLGQRARRYYSESVEQSPDDFLLMIIVDGIFLLELMLRSRYRQYRKSGDDPILNRPRMLVDVCRDILLIENQLPLFVLQELYQQFVLPHPPADGIKHLSLARLAHDFINNAFLVDNDNAGAGIPPTLTDHGIPPTLTDGFLLHEDSNAHLVAFVQSFCFLRWKRTPSSPSDGDNYRRISNNANDISITVELFPPSVTELDEAGIKFEILKPTRRGTAPAALNIEFDGGRLKIPCLDYQTGTLLLNLMVFEEYGKFPSDRKYVSQFMFFMGRMIRTTKDVDILMESEIISRMLGSNRDLLALFDRISRMGWPHDYFDLCEQLKDYCKSNPWHNWKATLKRDYFDTPWKIASTIAAVILLILTFMQTVCSFLSLN